MLAAFFHLIQFCFWAKKLSASAWSASGLAATAWIRQERPTVVQQGATAHINPSSTSSVEAEASHLSYLWCEGGFDGGRAGTDAPGRARLMYPIGPSVMTREKFD